MTQNKSSLEVLNISNTTSTGLLVLNDQRLLETMQQFPFLYNRNINPQNDPDYEEWAWNCISKVFNRSYLPQQVNFSPKDLMIRWQTLHPLILSLHKSLGTAGIPQSLSSIIGIIATQMENPLRNIELTSTQKLIYENIPMVQRLSMDDRRKLEADIMELLIDNELNAKANMHLDSNELQQIETEYDEFLHAIRLKELFVFSSDVDSNGAIEANPADDIDLFTENSSTPEVVEHCDPLNNDEALFMLKTERTADGEARVSLIALNGDDDFNPAAVAADVVAEEIIKNQDELLQPLEPVRYVPINQAHLHVRRCCVRIRRTNVEDILPLAVLKREKAW